MSLHSKLGASSYERWKACPGSIRECEGVQKQTSVYAERGTFYHGVASAILTGKTILPRQTHTFDGITMEVEIEDLEAVMTYVEWVLEHKTAGFQVIVERRFHLKDYHPMLFGTSDVVLYHPQLKMLVVGDYKHGQGTSVEVMKDGKPNSQAIYYGLGAWLELNLQVDTFAIAIIQPRCFHPDGAVRVAQVEWEQMFDALDQLVRDAKATEAPNAPLVPGSHCKNYFCPAAYKCPALREFANSVQTTSPFTAVNAYDPKELGKALDRLPLLEEYVDSVRQFAYQEAVQGRCPPGWKLVDKRAMRKWADPDRAKIMFSKEADISLFFDEPTLKSVTQIEKNIGKKEFKKQYAGIVVQISSGKTLVPENDSRPEIKDVSPFDEVPKQTNRSS